MIQANQMRAGERRKFAFGEYELLPERRLLLKDGQEVDLAGKAFDALVLLVEHSPGLATKEELMSALWPDTNVSEGSLSSQIWTLRKTLGEGRWIENVPRRGYQFVGEVHLLPDEANGAPQPQPSPSETPEPANAKEPANPDSNKWKAVLGWTLCVLFVFSLLTYAWRHNAEQAAHPVTANFLGNALIPLHFTADGFTIDEAFVYEALSHGIWWRIKRDTRSWPESMFQPWRQYRNGGRVRKENGRMIVDAYLKDPAEQAIWSETYSQPFPLAETVMSDVIGEHMVRLLEQGHRETSPGPASFDAVHDFSLTLRQPSNWRYGQVRDWTGIGFRPLTVPIPDPNDSCWTIEAHDPDHGFICLANKIIQSGSTVLSPDALHMTTGSQFTTLRWVAPADGRYSVHGRIRVIDTTAWPCRVKLAHNTVDVLLERRNFAGFGSTIPIDFPELRLTQASALDVIFGPEVGVGWMSIDVQLAIRPILPR